MTKPLPDVTPNTWEFLRDPMIKPTGFREYDARWKYPEEINLPGMTALGLGLGTQMIKNGVKPVIAVGNDYRIVNRVRLQDIIETKDSIKGRAKRSAMIKASNKVIDYVLCDPATYRIIAAVDLVNQAEGGHKSKQDWFVTGALEAAGIPHIRIKVKAGYKVEEIRNGILYKIGKKERAYPPEPIIKGNIPRRPVGALSAGQVKAQLGGLGIAKAS